MAVPFSWLRWLQQFLPLSRRPARARGFRPHVEVLEKRLNPFTVTNPNELERPVKTCPTVRTRPASSSLPPP